MAQASHGNRVMAWVLELILAGILAAFLLPIGLDAWTDDFDTSMLGGGAQALHSVGDLVFVLAIFIALFVGAMRLRRRR